MSELGLRAWRSLRDGHIRVYVSTRYLWGSDELKAADGAYFYAGDDGETKVMFRPCMSGRYGHAAFACRDYLQVDGVPFADFLARLDAAQTKGGNFSAVRYFKNLAQKEPA